MRKTKILSTLTLATLSLMCLTPVANAEGTDNTKTAAESSTVSLSVDETAQPSQLILIGSEKTQTIEVQDNEKTIAELSEEYGFKIENFKNIDGEIVEEDYKLAESENLLLFKSESSATSETIDLTIPTVEEETDDLYVGEKKVKSEGKPGKALKTTITTKDLSSDKSVNKEAKKSKEASVSEKLTVLTAPEPKIVLVGTKEKPAPEPVVEVDEELETALAETIENSNNEVETATEQPAVSNTDGADRDPISGEPLNNSETSTQLSAPVSSSGMSGYSSANGANTKASGKAPSSIVKSNSARGQKAVELAYTRLGVDYNWGSSRDDAVDCSGLIYWIYSTNLGVDIPRTANQQGSSAQQVPLNQLQPGDLLWTSSHIGIYIGNGQMIHASRSNDQVVVSGIGWFVDQGAKGARIP